MWGDSHVLHPVRPGEWSPTALGGTILTSAQAPADNSDLNKRHGTCPPNSVQSESLLPEHEVTRRLRCPRLVWNVCFFGNRKASYEKKNCF